jgi:hypothetical protein
MAERGESARMATDLAFGTRRSNLARAARKIPTAPARKRTRTAAKAKPFGEMGEFAKTMAKRKAETAVKRSKANALAKANAFVEKHRRAMAIKNKRQAYGLRRKPERALLGAGKHKASAASVRHRTEVQKRHDDKVQKMRQQYVAQRRDNNKIRRKEPHRAPALRPAKLKKIATPMPSRER